MLELFSLGILNFQALVAGILPLDYFLLLKLCDAKSEHSRLYFQFMG